MYIYSNMYVRIPDSQEIENECSVKSIITYLLCAINCNFNKFIHITQHSQMYVTIDIKTLSLDMEALLYNYFILSETMVYKRIYIHSF